jgi:uncharacterized protein YxjI
MSNVHHWIQNFSQLFVKQKKEVIEILTSMEMVNKYEILDVDKQVQGYIIERKGGFLHILKRLIFRSHRSFEIDILDQSQLKLCFLSRPFFWFFSSMLVVDTQGKQLAKVNRRFGIIHKKYDLIDETGYIFAKISSPLWRLWSFPVKLIQKEEIEAEITKKWGGALSEIFTDADTFLVDFKKYDWTPEQRLAIFAASISIDFDFFDNNQ